MGSLQDVRPKNDWRTSNEEGGDEPSKATTRKELSNRAGSPARSQALHKAFRVFIRYSVAHLFSPVYKQSAYFLLIREGEGE